MVTDDDQVPRDGPWPYSLATTRASAVHHESLEEGEDSDSDGVHQMWKTGLKVTCHTYSAGQPDVSSQWIPCSSCGEDHARQTCHFHDTTCQACSKTDLITCAYRSKLTRDSPGRVKPRLAVCLQEGLDVFSMEPTRVLTLPARMPGQIYVNIPIDGALCNMHWDMGSPVSIVSAKTLWQLCPQAEPLSGQLPSCSGTFKITQ